MSRKTDFSDWADRGNQFPVATTRMTDGRLNYLYAEYEDGELPVRDDEGREILAEMMRARRAETTLLAHITTDGTFMEERQRQIALLAEHSITVPDHFIDIQARVANCRGGDLDIIQDRDDGDAFKFLLNFRGATEQICRSNEPFLCIHIDPDPIRNRVKTRTVIVTKTSDATVLTEVEQMLRGMEFMEAFDMDQCFRAILVL